METDRPLGEGALDIKNLGAQNAKAGPPLLC